jgi:hypothetical protein
MRIRLQTTNVKFRESIVPRTGDTQFFVYEPDRVAGGAELPEEPKIDKAAKTCVQKVFIPPLARHELGRHRSREFANAMRARNTWRRKNQVPDKAPTQPSLRP